jgi:predicted ArsR family transcriptional regulator
MSLAGLARQPVSRSILRLGWHFVNIYMDIIDLLPKDRYDGGIDREKGTTRMSTRWNERFFGSTRGQVIAWLRRRCGTVDELAQSLGLTDNAIRAHLTALERDGLVQQGESRRTGGKPSYTYELTAEAERLFPKAYGTIVNELLQVLGERLPEPALEDALRETGRRLACGQPATSGSLEERVAHAQQVLSNLGGLTELETPNEAYVIQGYRCPIADAVDGSVHACLIAEALLGEVMGVRVRQDCDPGPPPRCRFVVDSHGDPAQGRG